MSQKSEMIADAARKTASVSPLTFAVVASAIGATLLIASEFVVVALALDWSVSGLLGLGRNGMMTGAVIMAPFLLYGCWWTFRRTLAVERRMSADT
ncbi:MAG: hypothetical protein AB7O39_14780 [Flavobacteriaceae bacterium]